MRSRCSFLNTRRRPILFGWRRFFCGVGELRRWRDVIAPHSLIRKLNSEQTAEPHSLFLIDSRSNKFVDYQSK